MNKLIASATIATIIAFMWLGFRLAAGTLQVQAAQCWDPGCCGYSLVYNQWSCQSAEASGLCRDTGESPTWVCNSNGLTNDDEVICRNFLCNGQPCEWRCPLSDWGNQCVITSGNVACSHPNDSTCTANVIAQQCVSQAGVNDCSNYNGTPDIRSCWVSGSATPTPGPSPTPGGPPPTGTPADTYLETVVQVWLDSNRDGIKNDSGEPSVDIPMTINIRVGSDTYGFSYPSHTNCHLADNRHNWLRSNEGGEIGGGNGRPPGGSGAGGVRPPERPIFRFARRQQQGVGSVAG